MATLDVLGALTNSASIQRRVALAMGVAAAAVYSEVGTTPGHAARAAFAVKVSAGQYNLQACAYCVLGQSQIAGEANTTAADNGIPDADIQTSVNSLWNLFAGA